MSITGNSTISRKQDLEKYLFDADHMRSVSNGEFEQVLVFGTSGKPVRARTVNQLALVNDYRTNDLVIAEGPAGTGKTYTSIALAVKALKEREVKKIILTRPAVEAGERLGFLPGDMKEKLDPYLQPLYDALHDMLAFQEARDMARRWYHTDCAPCFHEGANTGKCVRNPG